MQINHPPTAFIPLLAAKLPPPHAFLRAISDSDSETFKWVVIAFIVFAIAIVILTALETRK